MPNALPRSFGSVNVVASRDRADGASNAAKTPWQARAVTSIVKLTEAPPTAEAAANPASPVRKVTLRPIRSASRPPNSSRLPNDSEYAVTIHCRSALVNPSARCADGSARFITVTSRTIMRAAKQMVARTSHRRESASPALTMLLKRLVVTWVVDIWVPPGKVVAHTSATNEPPPGGQPAAERLGGVPCAAVRSLHR